MPGLLCFSKEVNSESFFVISIHSLVAAVKYLPGFPVNNVLLSLLNAFRRTHKRNEKKKSAVHDKKQPVRDNFVAILIRMCYSVYAN